MVERVNVQEDGALTEVAVSPPPAAAETVHPPAAMPADVYRTLLENMTEGVSLSAEDGTIVYTNPAEDRMFGYGPGELVGQHVSVQNAYPQAENQRLVAEVIEHLRACGSWEGEWLNRRKDDAVFITASRISAVEVDGRPHWLCVQRDITRSRRADERLRAIFKNAGVGMVAMERDCRIRQANDAYAQIVGRDHDVLVGMSCLDFTHPDDVEANLHALAELEQHGRVAFEKRYLGAGGRIVWVRITLSSIDDDGVLAIVEDVTARVRAEQVAHRRSAQLQALADATLTITQAPTLEATLDEITKAARRIIGAHQGVVSLTRSPDWSQAINAVEITDKYAAWEDCAAMPDGSGIDAWLCEGNRSVRLTQEDLEAHPRWRGFGPHAAEHSPIRGWLAAPIVGRDGRNLGLIQLSDKEDGLEFDEADEAVLVQLAHVASAAVEQAQTEAALRDSEGRFRLMADAVPQIVWITDAEGRTEFFNKHWSRLHWACPSSRRPRVRSR
jgi:PAS domain S-box-containing protein